MIFVSHAWQNGKPDPRVLQFVDFLRKNGYQPTTKQFMQIGVPFTLIAVISAYIFIWLIWA